MKILVTGFDAFGDNSINPSSLILEHLPDTLSNHQIIKLQIPTIAFKSLDIIHDCILKEQPDFILSLGQASGRKDITVERIGINCDDYSICDNNNYQPTDMKIFNNGPDAYFSNLPVKEIIKNIQHLNIPCSISNSAGTFVCNHVLYGVRHLCEIHFSNIKSGFIHIPCIPEQTEDNSSIPSMESDIIVKAIICAIETILKE